jgi:hypothetical protein
MNVAKPCRPSDDELKLPSKTIRSLTKTASPSPLPSPSGRGRIDGHRTPYPGGIETSKADHRYSLSSREKVRVRVELPLGYSKPRTSLGVSVELLESSGRAGGFQTRQ